MCSHQLTLQMYIIIFKRLQSSLFFLQLFSLKKRNKIMTNFILVQKNELIILILHT